MKRRIVLLAALAVWVVPTWYVGMQLSSDALAMVAGLLAGALAGVPAALFALYVGRRADVDAHDSVGTPAITAPTYPGQAEIENALEPYRREDERLEAAAQRRGWGCDNG